MLLLLTGCHHRCWANVEARLCARSHAPALIGAAGVDRRHCWVRASAASHRVATRASRAAFPAIPVRGKGRCAVSGVPGVTSGTRGEFGPPVRALGAPRHAEDDAPENYPQCLSTRESLYPDPVTCADVVITESIPQCVHSEWGAAPASIGRCPQRVHSAIHTPIWDWRARDLRSGPEVWRTVPQHRRIARPGAVFRAVGRSVRAGRVAVG